MQDDIEKALNAHLPNRIIEFNENSSILNVSDYEVGFRDGYRAHAARSGWVAIDDPIVDDWKDGRRVDLFNSYTQRRMIGFFWENGKWYDPTYKVFPIKHGCKITTHAMLPPPPPQSKGGE